MSDNEIVQHSSCFRCGQAVTTRSVETSDEVVRMTFHDDPGDDPTTRCDYDGGPFMDGTKRSKQYPGDTYP